MNEHSKIASRWASKVMSWIIIVYLFLKTLINPVFTVMDSLLADLMLDSFHTAWLEMICNASLAESWLETPDVYLPEARADVLFELGLYFPKEK